MKILDRRYNLQQELFRDKYGILYHALDQELSRELTIREILSKQLKSSEEIRNFVKTSFNSMQVSSTGIEKPNSIRISDEKSLYIFYNKYKTVSFRKLIDNYQQLWYPPEFSLAIIRDAANILHDAHNAREHASNRNLKLFHLSLNPEKIKLTSESNLLITGFGESLQEIPNNIEQARYLAPEQISGSAVDQRSDIYSLAVIAAELLCGQPLFPEDNIKIIMSNIIKGEYDLGKIAEHQKQFEILPILKQALTVKRRKRFTSALEFAEKINDILSRDKIQYRKKISEYVEKFAEKPLLIEADIGGQSSRQNIHTKPITIQEFDKGFLNMSQASGKDGGKRKPRRGEETVLRSTPVAEKFKRAKSGGMGGNKSVFILSSIAAVLAIVVIGLIIWKYVGGKSDADSVEPDKMKTGSLTTLPENAEVFWNDSLLGTTPLTFSVPEDAEITVRHQCCPDTNLEVNFEAWEDEVLTLMTSLLIDSDPQDAEIVLNGKTHDQTTPASFDLSGTDTINVILNMTGKKPLKSGKIVLSEMNNYDSDNFSLNRQQTGGLVLTGSLKTLPKMKIRTAPSGAKVRLKESGVLLGTTPLEYDFGADATTIVFSKDGYENREEVIPPRKTRKKRILYYLFRSVSITAYEKDNIDQTVNCRIKHVIYGGKSHPKNETSPASIRLPGVDCRILLTADGYYDTDTLISPNQNRFVAVMTKRISTQDVVEKEEEKPPVGGIPKGKAEVKIFVTDKKDQPVAGVTLQSEWEHKVNGKKVKELIELGITDEDGRFIAYPNPGKHKIIAKHVDYKKGDQKKDIKEAGKSYLIRIQIKRR